MSNIFFTSDTHYSHQNICRGVSKWGHFEAGSSHQDTRDFNTLAEMNQAIVKGINNKVGENDILYHLGDWSFGGIEQIWDFRKQINCKNIHLIFGNHDQHIENNKLLPNSIWNETHDIIIDKNKNDYYIEYTDLDITNEVFAKSLFKSTGYVREVKVGKETVFLSHYAHRVWNKSHHDRIHLYGHSHGSLEDNPWGRSMDVGIDAYYRLFKRYEPFSLKEIIDIMNNRKVLIIDHHNPSTN